MAISGIEGCNSAGVSDSSQKTPDTSISPARDLTGQWEGMVKFSDVAQSPICEYQGKIKLDLAQKNSGLVGTWQINIEKITPLSKSQYACVKTLGPGPLNDLRGEVSSSQFSFSTIDFPDFAISGTFTSDLMEGRINFCMPYGQCPGGIVGSEGTFSAMRK